MSEPLLYLLIGTAVILLSVIIFAPGGIAARRKRNRKNTLRAQLEDALKHLYDCEYKALTCTINSIAGNLSISADAASGIVKRLEEMGLVATNAEKIELTAEGRSYALRVIRIHRLWEKFLADETSMHDTEWHTNAEQMEHRISVEEAERLAAKLGNPFFDPHGDPIPTPDGELPRKKWKPLSGMKPGELALIAHMEDEPAAVYAQLVAEGLYTGMHIRMLETTKDYIRFEAKSEEVKLAPMLAANISVVDIPAHEAVIEHYENLTSIKTGEKARVLGIAKACRGQQRRRLMDLGVVPGSIITSEFVSAGGDPVAYSIKGATVALRKQTARHIYIRKVNEEKRSDKYEYAN